MGNHKLRGKDLSAIAYDTNELKSLTLGIMSKHFKHLVKTDKLQLLKAIKDQPATYASDEILGRIAAAFITNKSSEETLSQIALKDAGPLNVFGRKHILSNAYQQMEWAMKLPIVETGALMPDAHLGYGLPIGGVVATKNAVIPYGVGVDIGCGMKLSIFNANVDFVKRYQFQLTRALKDVTYFGNEIANQPFQDHPVLAHDLFTTSAFLRPLKTKAARQLGSSGSGNHFVEFGVVNLHGNNGLGVEPGEYLALLSHSGSRGIGAAIAKRYTELAVRGCRLPKPVQHLAWLDLDTDLGEEYWLSMNLAGEYAMACHHQIHKNVSKHVGLRPLASIENHHNFAWKSTDDNGNEVIIHRKGSTPAGKGELGIIPGSMATEGYLVRGKGHPGSLNSASHGAGRKMSRNLAKSSLTKSQLRQMLKRKGVSLIGGGVDESPGAYKDIAMIMKSQSELVEVTGTFMPKIVRMDKD